MSDRRKKIIDVSKFLYHGNKEYRIKAVRKLENYLSRGYDKKLIIKIMKECIGSESDSECLRLLERIISKHSKSLKQFKGLHIGRLGLKTILLLLILFGVISLFIFDDNEKNINKILKSSKTVVSEIKDSEEITLLSAESIKLGKIKSFGEVRSFNNKLSLRFSPKLKSNFRSKIKIIQQISSDGRKISQKKVEFILNKKVINKYDEGISSVLTYISNYVGGVNPQLLGFPRVGRKLIFDIDKNNIVRNIRTISGKKSGSANIYLFPFPLFPSEKMKAQGSWGSEMSRENFAVKSKYIFEGFVKYRKIILYKISFLSVSRSKDRNSTFMVSRKGVFFVESKTGIPHYVKLYTLSETKLVGSGFPVENIVVIEESKI